MMKKVFLSGNEMAVKAAEIIDFDVMGYFPITPSTEIAEGLAKASADGRVSTRLIAAEGEHGAAGICFGAATTGARVLNATSANGLLYSLEQLPVQAGTRLPMVLNLVTRSVSGPLDIRCDHSDLVYALSTGWIILCAANPQEVYDLNLIAVRLGEDPRIRLPVMVVQDGFFTSHQKQEGLIFDQRTTEIESFLKRVDPPFSSINPDHPVTIGPYMNQKDLILNKWDLHLAHERVPEVFREICQGYFQISGRRYDELDVFGDEHAKSAVLVLNSAAETFRDLLDQEPYSAQDFKIVRPRILRPFPYDSLIKNYSSVKSTIVAERVDVAGSNGGPLSHELKTALFHHQRTDMTVCTRVYGLGGREFTLSDAKEMLSELQKEQKNPRSIPLFKMMGIPPFVEDVPSTADSNPGPSFRQKKSEWIQVQNLGTDENPKLNVILPDRTILAQKPKAIEKGHGACPGCGIFPALQQFFRGIEGDLVVLYHTGCAMVVTTDYPYTSHQVNYIHNLFQNGAPTLSGAQTAFEALQEKSLIPKNRELTFVMISGDGGIEIGLGATIASCYRNSKIIVLEYDNQGYMNTGGQLSLSTPRGHETSTSRVGKNKKGKSYSDRPNPLLFWLSGASYVFTAIEDLQDDLIQKAAKAQWYAQNKGFVYGKVLTACPLNWGSEERRGREVLNLAVRSKAFPLYEIENDILKFHAETYREDQQASVKDYFSSMRKTAHLLLPENEELLKSIEQEIQRKFAILESLTREKTNP